MCVCAFVHKVGISEQAAEEVRPNREKIIGGLKKLHNEELIKCITRVIR